MMLNLVLVVSILWGFRLLLDAHRLIRKATVAIDRDQSMLDQIDEPEYPDMEEPHGVIVVDLTMSESDAVLRFVESFRQLKDQHDRNT